MFNRAFALAAAAMVAGGCSSLFPDPVTGTQTLLVIGYDPKSSTYQFVPEQVSTLQDLRTMKGNAAQIYAGGTITANYSALIMATSADLGGALIPGAGHLPDFAYYDVKTSGQTVIYPEDLDSLNMATIYYNVEQAYLFFQNFNAQLSAPVPVYYLPSFTANPATVTSPTDFGITDPPLGLIVVTPSDASTAEQEPTAMQPGVQAYEYAANVFDIQALGSTGIPDVDTKYAQQPMSWAPALNITRSFRAGFSDFFAAVITGDPNFVHSTGVTPDPTRQLDPSQPRCLNSEMIDPSKTRGNYDPHPLGSILSEVLWDTEANRGDIQQSYNQSVIAAMKAFGTQLSMDGPSLTLARAADAVAGAIVSQAQPHFCAVLQDRLGLQQSDLPHCTQFGESPIPSCSAQ
jgi:hypothetical protein